MPHCTCPTPQIAFKAPQQPSCTANPFMSFPMQLTARTHSAVAAATGPRPRPSHRVAPARPLLVLPKRTRMTETQAYRDDKSSTPGSADVAPSQAKKTGAETIKLGSKLPMDHKVYIFEDGADAPREVSIGEVLGGKRAVLFGLPGAYTSICSSKHVPEYKQKMGMLKEQGVELVACISVNDAYVMRKWAQELGVNPSDIVMLADGDASFHKAIGLNQVLPGLGERAFRYSMYLEDGVIKVLNVEEPGGKSYNVSGPSHMTEDLKALKAAGGGDKRL